MPSSLQPSTYRRGVDARSRAGAAILALGLIAILMMLLLRLGVLPAKPPREPHPTFTLLPAGEKEATAPRPHPRRARQDVARAASRPPPAPTPPPPVPAPAPAPMLAMNHDAFAATDIGRIARAPGNDDEGDTAVDTAAVAGPGEGPGGARLYNAQWYREPPAGALALYLPNGPAPGWATIACKTIRSSASTTVASSTRARAAPASPARCARRRGSSRFARPGWAGGR